MDVTLLQFGNSRADAAAMADKAPHAKAIGGINFPLMSTQPSVTEPRSSSSHLTKALRAARVAGTRDSKSQ